MLTITQALELVHLYLTGRYSQQHLADLFGVCQTTAGKVLAFRSPYNELASLLTCKQLERLAYVKRVNRGGNAETARAIQRMLDAGHRPVDVARAHGVSKVTVWRIGNGHTWGWLGG